MDGDNNSKFFHSFASFRDRSKRIVILMDGDRRLEDKNSISDHIVQFFKALYRKESWNRPTLEHLAFDMLDLDVDFSLEGEFLEEEIKAAAFNLGEDRAP